MPDQVPHDRDGSIADMDIEHVFSTGDWHESLFNPQSTPTAAQLSNSVSPDPNDAEVLDRENPSLYSGRGQHSTHASSAPASGSTALHQAVFDDNKMMVQLLIENNAHMGAQDDYGETPLHLACRLGHTSLVTCLLSSSGVAELLLHLTDNEGHNALHTSVKYARFDIVQLLIKNGVDIDSRRQN